MTSRKNVLIIAIIAAFTLTAGTALADESDNRMKTQRDRIAEGLRSGSLTNREAKRLLTQQARIEKRSANLRKDGELSAKEAKKLDNFQQKAAHRIYKLKQNQRTQNR